MVPRWVLGVAAAVVLVAVIDAGVFLVAHDGTPPVEAGSPRSSDTVAVIDPTTSRIVDRVHVGRMPTIVAAGHGGAWVLNRGEGTLTHIDPGSHHVVDTLDLDITATDLALGAGGLWITGRPRGDAGNQLQSAKFERVDPGSGRVDREFDTQTGAFALAAGGNALWTTGVLPGHIRGTARSDAETGAMRALDVEVYGDLIAADERAVYWVGSVGNHVVRVSTRTGLRTASLALATDASLAAGNVPPNPTDVAIGGGSLWISAIDGSVIRVDPELKGIVASIPVCRHALALTYGEGAVWVACGEATVVRVDPKTDVAGPPIQVGELPRGIAAGDGAIWVTLN